MDEASPLYDLACQIKGASDNSLYLLSLSACVALPDICVSLASDEDRSTGVEYQKWCAENLGSNFPYITPDDLYSLRCGVLQSGKLSDLKHGVKRVVVLPPTGLEIIGTIIGDAYVHNVVEFCQRFSLAALDWYKANRDVPVVKANSERMMRYRVGGLLPYVSGATVIA